MHPNELLITRFYNAFQKRDGAAMAACYHAGAQFSDPAFGTLHGERIGQMWQMLCERGKDLEVTFRDVAANDTAGAAHWEARYTFSRSARSVHNVIEARFTLRDGLILTHSDSFSFWRWSAQALGLPGILLGWSPFLRKKVRQQSLKSLDDYTLQRGTTI